MYSTKKKEKVIRIIYQARFPRQTTLYRLHKEIPKQTPASPQEYTSSNDGCFFLFFFFLFSFLFLPLKNPTKRSIDPKYASESLFEFAEASRSSRGKPDRQSFDRCVGCRCLQDGFWPISPD